MNIQTKSTYPYARIIEYCNANHYISFQQTSSYFAVIITDRPNKARPQAYLDLHTWQFFNQMNRADLSLRFLK